jgi:arabinose-5-phosphate isomerase
MHGDLGMISKEDVVIAISYSGESDEIIGIIPNIKLIGATLVAISSNKESTLVKYADIAQILPNLEEACYLGLAPTSSTTCELCYGDALAVVASRIYGFDDMDFGKRHPAGSLGKKLILKVDDLMATEQDIAVVNESSSLMEAVVEMAEKGLGIVIVTDNSDTLLGVITDGDLRRQLSNKADIYSMSVKSVMSTSPKTVEKGMLAIQALNLMKGKKVSALPVLDEGKKVVGVIKLSHIVEAGIVV